MASKCNTVFCYLKEQSPTECSASRKTRLQSLFEEENTVNHGIPPATLLEIHEKKDLEEDEEDNKKKVRSVLFYPFVFFGGVYCVFFACANRHFTKTESCLHWLNSEKLKG